MSSLPTLYEFYTSNGISSGLSANQNYFTLNDRNITLFSGALHYFRVPQEYWRDRLRKMRAAGLNAVETYVPWNLHEPEPGTYDFGKGGTDFEEFLNIEKFLKIAQEEDLFAIVRPGPYICSEWEFGGLPSWLLRDKDMKIRTSDYSFMKHVMRYFKVLLPILSILQFTKGGPIIAFQIENEYGNTKNGDEPVDIQYLEQLKGLFLKYGTVELLFTSDTPSNGFSGSLPDILYTANFQTKPEKELLALKNFQPNKPLMVMEYWTGWFDHWTEKHHTRSNDEFSSVLEKILSFPSSVNFYMFHGGTNWGFMNGANILDSSTDNAGYLPDTSSYDYDAPLTEAGDYTNKYYSAKTLIAKYNNEKTRIPDMPELKPRVAYPTVKITEYMDLKTIIQNAAHHINTSKVISMEDLEINNNTGQQYGYIVYRKHGLHIPGNSTIKINGRICDTAMILINNVLISKVVVTKDDFNKSPYWKVKDYSINLGATTFSDAVLEIVVENSGRNNYGKLNQFQQRKGLWQGPVVLNDEELKDWEIVPLEFKKKWITNLTAWNKFESGVSAGPGFYKTKLLINHLSDTFIDTRQWKKGFIIINGFVLSRYFNLGPQQTVYIPAPLLRLGENEIIFFEHFVPSNEIKFLTDPIYETL